MIIAAHSERNDGLVIALHQQSETLAMLQFQTPIVYVVDNDISVRESLAQLICSAGWQPETFASAHEFLARPQSPASCCLIVDAALPYLNGLQLQERVAERRYMPIIFLTRQDDVSMAVKAMKAGALEFLTKPFDTETLLNAIRYGIKRSEAVLVRESKMQTLRTNYGSLSRREREVMRLVASGLLNKQVGGELGISEITVKAHRGNVMRKMKASSFAALVDMAAKLHLEHFTKEHLPFASMSMDALSVPRIENSHA